MLPTLFSPWQSTEILWLNFVISNKKIFIDEIKYYLSLASDSSQSHDGTLFSWLWRRKRGATDDEPKEKLKVNFSISKRFIATQILAGILCI